LIIHLTTKIHKTLYNRTIKIQHTSLLKSLTNATQSKKSLTKRISQKSFGINVRHSKSTRPLNLPWTTITFNCTPRHYNGRTHSLLPLGSGFESPVRPKKPRRISEKVSKDYRDVSPSTSEYHLNNCWSARIRFLSTTNHKAWNKFE
jgi:hypothetical protein